MEDSEEIFNIKICGCGFVYESGFFKDCPVCILLSHKEKKRQDKKLTAKQTRRKDKRS